MSPGPVEICRKVMPEGDFRICEANRLPFDAGVFDAVICNSVFQYFPDLSYAEEVLHEMLRVLSWDCKGAVLDINYAREKEQFEAARRRKLGDHEYERLYGNHPHLFYERSWFVALAKKYNLEHAISDQSIPGYINSDFRFNFYFYKRKTELLYELKYRTYHTIPKSRSDRSRSKDAEVAGIKVEGQNKWLTNS